MNSKKGPNLSTSWLLYLFKTYLDSAMHFRKALSTIRKLYSDRLHFISSEISLIL